MINPKEVIRMVEAAWQDDPKRISIAQAEGFIRQVVGWREYMRGIYWAEMPGFAALNYFGSKGKLPDYFWTGNTKMNCVSVAVRQSLQHAYAHHIQRLMITGNFCSLAGIDPDETDLWYMGIYIDAFDWVEITNTRGMSQFADGGIVGTKPYVSSASYIHKMGDHCGSCHYDHKKKTGDKACPFNSLYWHFLHRNREKLSSNQRMSMMYRVLDKMDEDNLQAILKQADTYLSEIEEL
jgi:deoxyribodipyrimidine photolyase-related protein